MRETPSLATIFVVDDDRGLLRLIEKSLRREGFTAITAASGREAIDWLHDHRADLMLLDLKLQDIEGKELVTHLSSIDRAVPFIIITGQGDERVAVEMMKRGALDYLVKDADFLTFVPAVVQRALQQVEQQRKLAAAEEALKKEHEFVSALLETSGALVLVLDRSGAIVRFNPACERTTGYAAAEVQGKCIWELFLAPEDAGLFKRIFDESRPQQFPAQYENNWLTRDGRQRLIAWSTSALLDQGGNVEFVIAGGIDITERRRLEKEILEISEFERQRLGQDLHDGLCQHLAGIELMSQVLGQALEKKSKPQAAQAGKIAEHVRESISQTRMLARGLSPVELESNGLISALEELSVNTEKLFKVSCSFTSDPAALLNDNAVATHLYRIAQEAVSNAIRHGKARELQIRLTTNRGEILLEVRDQGTGLPDVLPKGKGMGLRIMQYRAGMIGGRLQIQKGAAGGTTVSCAVRNQLLKSEKATP